MRTVAVGRWCVWRLGCYVLLGLSTSLVGYFFGAAGFTTVLLAAAAVFVLPLPVQEAFKKLLVLRKQLTWWHALWLLLFLSGLVFRQRDTQAIEKAPVDFWAAYRIVLVSATAFVLLLRLALRQTDWIRSLFRGLVGALAIYALVSVASTLWSIYPAWTAYRSLEYFVDVALLGAILATVPSTDRYKTLFDWTWALVGGLLITVWAGAMAWPEEAWVRGGGLLGARLAGVLPVFDQNSVGEYAAFLAIVALTRLQFPTRGRGQAFYWMLLMFGLVTLVLSQTRVAIVGFLLGALFVLVFCRRIGVIAFVASAVVLIFLFADGGDWLWKLWQRGERLEDLQDLSGRLTMWKFGLEKFLERPLTGYGAYAGARFAVITQVADPQNASVLNTYVEVILGTGIWGLSPLVFVLMGSWWLLIRSLRRFSFGTLEHQLAVEAVGILAVVTTRSFFTTHLIWHPASSFLMIVGYAEFLRRQWRQRKGTGVPALTAICR
jgi:hypothetical protein